MCYKKRYRANIIVGWLPRSFSMLEIRATLSDLGLGSFVARHVSWEEEHVRFLKTVRS